MKITSTKLLLLILTLNMIMHEAVITCEKLETIASFKSHFGMFKAKKAKSVASKSTKSKSKLGDESGSSPAPSTTAEAPSEKSVQDTNETDITQAGEIEERDLYFKGWVKYFRYANRNGQEKPKMFFKNKQFARQQLDPKKDENKVSLSYKFLYENFMNFYEMYNLA